MPAKTVNNSAAEPDVSRFWNCPVCGVWRQVDSDGNVGDHFSTYGSCPGSGEPTALTVSTPYIHTITHRALKDAVKWGRLSRNPADAADPPKAAAASRPESITWTADQLRTFLDGTPYE